MTKLSNKLQNYLLIYLFLGIVFINVWSYLSIYLFSPNSLKFSFVYLLLGLPIIFVNPNKFVNYIYCSKYNRISLAFILFILLDVLINYPLNKYKIDTYTLVYLVVFFNYIFDQLDQNKVINFIYYTLIIWLVVSVLEYIILQKYTIIHQLAFDGIGIQNIVFSGASYHGKGIHGLGLTSQVNISALIFVIIFSYNFINKNNNFFKNLIFLILFITSILILPFSLSLTAVVAVLIALFFIIMKKYSRFGISMIYSFLLLFSIFSFSTIFVVGSLIGVTASTGNESSYMYDLFLWPLEFFFNNFIYVFSGFLNDIPSLSTPLENRYFNVLLCVGVFFSLYLFFTLFQYHKKLFSNIKTSRLNDLKFFIFTFLIVSYFHISYLPHTNSLILISMLFTFSINIDSETKSYRPLND